MALCLAAVPEVQANVPFWGDKATQSGDVGPGSLAPGQWVWNPQLAPSGPLLVYVDLDRQLGYAYRNGVLIGYTTVSSGKKGFETPTGVFHTLQKDRDHRSSVYNNAPMPYTQRLTWGGVALHAGGLPGYPSSHGCVHLPSAFAEQLFTVSPLGMTVVVARGASSPLAGQAPTLLAALDAQSGAPDAQPRLTETEAYRWTPDAAPAGPLALVASRADARLVVLRGGVEIGRARLAPSAMGALQGTQAYVAHRDPASRAMRWVGVAVPGHAAAAGQGGGAGIISDAALPPPFAAQLQRALDEGATLVVTDAAVLPHTTGAPTTVLTNQPPET